MTKTHAELTDAAKAAFTARAAALGDPRWEGVAAEAWENCFTVETHGEYRDDLHRWEVALATLDMLADERGIG